MWQHTEKECNVFYVKRVNGLIASVPQVSTEEAVHSEHHEKLNEDHYRDIQLEAMKQGLGTIKSSVQSEDSGAFTTIEKNGISKEK